MVCPLGDGSSVHACWRAVMARPGSLGVSYSVRRPDKFQCWRPRSLPLARQVRCRRSALGRAGPGFRACRCGVVTPAAGVLAFAPAGARLNRACVPGSRRDRPGVSREADATAVTLVSFRQAVAGRMRHMRVNWGRCRLPAGASARTAVACDRVPRRRGLAMTASADVDKWGNRVRGSGGERNGQRRD
jgi:hypothetical protein